MTDTIGYFYPNKLGRIILLSMEEVIGSNSLQSVLSLAGLNSLVGNYPADNLVRDFSFEKIGKIQEALETIFGPRGSKGLSLRVGRVAFKNGLREFGPLIGATDLNFRLAPLDQKLQIGADLLAEIFVRFSDQLVRVESDQDFIYWQIDRCPVCWNRHSVSPVCHLAVGLLEESIYWVSGGKTFKIVETNCIAKGDSVCTIQIDKQALD